MSTPGQQFFDDYLDFEANGYPLPAGERDEDDQDQYPPYYSAVNDGYGAPNAWDQTAGLMSTATGYLGGAYGQEGAIDGYSVPGARTESTTSDTRTSGQTSSDTWSRNTTRGTSKSSKSSAPSTDSGSTSSSKHKKGKHHASSSSSHHHHSHHHSSHHSSSHHHSSHEGNSERGGSSKTKGSSTSSSRDKGSSSKDKGVEKEQDKRDKFLERNRIAATKCRQKKKEWVNDLEEQKFGLESQNSHLQMEYNSLLGEVSRMKNQIMTHANCKDPNIDKWIENEARRFVQSTSDRYDRDQRVYAAMPGSAGGDSMYPMSAATPSYASSSYQNEDAASQMSPTDLGFAHDGSTYGELPAESRHYRHGQPKRKGSGHR